MERFAGRFVGFSVICALVGCSNSDVQLASSSSPLAGKAWSDAAALYYSDKMGETDFPESDLETADGVKSFSIRSFDVGGTDPIWVSGVWYDSSPTVATYVGAVRKFVFGKGFATEYTHFSSIVDNDSVWPVIETRMVSGLGSGLDILALFARISTTGLEVVPRYYSAGAWSTDGAVASTKWTISGAFLRYPFPDVTTPTLDRFKERYMTLDASRDSGGRVWVGAYPRTLARAEPDLDRRAYVGVWDSSTGLAAVAAPSLGHLGDDWMQSLPLAHDGTGQGCIGEVLADNGGLSLQCASEASGEPDLSGAATRLNFTNLSSTQAGGMRLASDRKGNTLAVWMESTASESGVFARFAVSGSVAATTTVQIDTGIESGYRPTLGFAGRGTAGMDSVAVASLGENDFLVAWVGFHATDLTAKMFAARHHPTLGWQAPVAVTDAKAFVLRIPFGSPELFSSGDGVVALAVRAVTAESGLVWTGTAPEHVNTDWNPLDETKMTVAMYEKSVGWQTAQTVGEGCIPSVGVAISYLGYCSHPPRGVALSSGKALILFQDRDNAGRYRLKAITFE